jgi:hypothetical protein
VASYAGRAFRSARVAPSLSRQGLRPVMRKQAPSSFAPRRGLHFGADKTLADDSALRPPFQSDLCP